MHRNVCSWLIVLLATCLLAAAEEGKQPDAGKLPPPSTAAVDFTRDIRPILEQRCISCHSAAKEKGGLRLDEAGSAHRGGNTGKVILPGKSGDSRLIHLVAGLDAETRMPPKGEPLTREEIGKLRTWIDRGAAWPTGVVLASKDTDKTTHWAFQPVQRQSPPPLSGDWPRNPIDVFVRARLQRDKLSPSREADKRTLIRRLSLDLLGLPPTPEEVEAFVHDSAPDAYERLVDRLLASPHYGERWGRHWLDAARYADSDGFEKDTGRPHAWRYRNWVIDALNRDLPYDQFTIEQLAGDLLPNATTEQKVATGFHRNTLTNKEGGVDREQFRVEQVVDRVNTTSKVFLGLTLACAQCHDHKYDPFTMRDYYQLFAFFNSDNEVDLPAPSPGELEIYNLKKAEFDRKHAELTSAVKEYTRDQLPKSLLKWESELKLPDLRKLPGNVPAILLIEPAKRTAEQVKELSGYYAKVDAKLAELNKSVTDHARKAPPQSLAQTLALGSPRKTHIMIRGDFLRPGAEVSHGTPAILTRTGSAEAKSRLDLARWVVDPSNPLTARVLVNWVWHKYFGRGLVATLEDFGTQGEKPSHPELLDWLAGEFIEQAWSLKRLHRLIVTSSTYRQTSQASPELLQRDPLNILLARQSRLRLEAEITRDNALNASGLLIRRIGGPSVRPPQPAGISELTYAGSAKWVESTGPDRFRRGLYTWFQRTSPHPMLMTFDSPDSNLCCVRRERSNTPLQALTLLNDTMFIECAQALGYRMKAAAAESDASIGDRLRHGFSLCLGREPTETEQEMLLGLFNDFLADARANPRETARLLGVNKGEDPAAVAWIAVARTLLNLDEFVTRE